MKSPSYTENNIQLYIINSSWKNKNKNLKKEKKKKKKKKKGENWKIGKFHTMRQVIVPTHTPHFSLGPDLGGIHSPWPIIPPA